MNQHGFHATFETQPSRVMFLNSSDSTIYNWSSHFSYVFKEAITSSPGEGVLVSLVSASIPYSFYNIRDGVNNRVAFTLSKYNDAASEHTSSFTITPGNYTAASLASALKEELEALRTFGTSAKEQVVTITHSRITQKFTFKIEQAGSVTGGRTLKLNFATSAATDLLKTELGFDESADAVLYHNDAVATPAPFKMVESPHVADMSASVHAIYVRTSLSTKSVMDSQTGGISDILTKVDINTNPGGVITLDPAQATHESLIYSKSIRDIHVRITDDKDRLLNLNGLHLQIAIKFRFVGRRPNNLTTAPPPPLPPPVETKTTKPRRRRKKKATK
eukprot:COSAG04_NODE_2482_length_4041_cov_4.531710_2_plen_333_part_00